MIALAAKALEAIRDHGREAYPEECCGVLLGTGNGGSAHVVRIERVANSRAEERRRRYSIDPNDYSRLERSADAEGLAILGFYHSHPDHPAVPSEYDREHSFPFFHYVVLAVATGSPGEIASYVLSEDREVFDREEIAVEGNEE